MSLYQSRDGCRLYYELYGPEGAPPLILLEGLGGDIPGWRRNIPRFASRYRVVAYDFRGNGRSDKPHGKVSMATFVEDTLGLLDHLEISSAHVYGQSFGGMVGIEMALSHPERVRSVILAATHAGRLRAVPVGVRGKVPKDRPYLALYSEGFASEHPEHVAEDILVGSQNPQPLHAGRRQWEAVEAWDAWDRLGEIPVPPPVLHGTGDRLVAGGDTHPVAPGGPPGPLVILGGVGHRPPSARP